MRLLAKQAIVVGMAPNPEPDDSIRGVDSQSSVVGADAHRPEPTDFLEVKCRMPRDLASGARRRDRQDRVPRMAGTDTGPRSRKTRDESERFGFAGSVITKGLACKVV
jgi:hypothetical protein